MTLREKLARAIFPQAWDIEAEIPSIRGVLQAHAYAAADSVLKVIRGLSRDEFNDAEDTSFDGSSECQT